MAAPPGRSMPALSLEAGACGWKFSTHFRNRRQPPPPAASFYPKPRVLLSYQMDDPQSQLRLRGRTRGGPAQLFGLRGLNELCHGYGVAGGERQPQARSALAAGRGAGKSISGTRAALCWTICAKTSPIWRITSRSAAAWMRRAIFLTPPRTTSPSPAQVPLDFLGLENALFKPNLYWTTSSLIDPVTGERRRISNASATSTPITRSPIPRSASKSTCEHFLGTSFSGPPPGALPRSAGSPSTTAPISMPAGPISPHRTGRSCWGRTISRPIALEVEQINFPGPCNLSGRPARSRTCSKAHQPRFVYTRSARRSDAAAD